MAGYMYLGNKKVCPAIVVKSGYDVKNAYFMENVFTSVDENGKLTSGATTTGDLVFTGFKDVGDNALKNKFKQDSSITSVLFNDLEKTTGNYACSSMFFGCTNIQSASFPKLKEISGMGTCKSMFLSCINLGSVSLPSLTTISGYITCESMFQNSGVYSVSFPKLSVISGVEPTGGMLGSCRNLESVYFPSLTTSSFDSIGEDDMYFWIFNDETAYTSGNVTVHFPSNLQSTMEGFYDYPNFGGESGYVTLAFDLPATS